MANGYYLPLVEASDTKAGWTEIWGRGTSLFPDSRGEGVPYGCDASQVENLGLPPLPRLREGESRLVPRYFGWKRRQLIIGLRSLVWGVKPMGKEALNPRRDIPKFPDIGKIISGTRVWKRGGRIVLGTLSISRGTQPCFIGQSRLMQRGGSVSQAKLGDAIFRVSQCPQICFSAFQNEHHGPTMPKMLRYIPPAWKYWSHEAGNLIPPRATPRVGGG